MRFATLIKHQPTGVHVKTEHIESCAKNVSCDRGFILLDALIAILIFSFGILGMMALQASAIKLAGDARYRTDAAMLADQVIAQMWGSDPKTATLQAAFAGSGGVGGARYATWFKTLDCASTSAGTGCLPGVAGHPPMIAIDSTNLVTVTVYWQAPNDLGPHNYVSITQITR